MGWNSKWSAYFTLHWGKCENDVGYSKRSQVCFLTWVIPEYL